MSASIASRPKAVTVNVRQRAQNWLSPLNLHWVGLAVLALVNLYLLLHMAFAWQQAKNNDAEAFAREQVSLRTAQIAAEPLQGLDVKLARASASADEFYNTRLPVSYSEVARELGVLSKRNNVRLTRVQYAQEPALVDATGQLTAVKMDASLSGDYRGLVVFLNNLERDKLFFLIYGVTLTGQQSGTVNLRVRLTTYLRGVGDEVEMQKVAILPDLTPPAGSAGGAR